MADEVIVSFRVDARSKAFEPHDERELLPYASDRCRQEFQTATVREDEHCWRDQKFCDWCGNCYQNQRRTLLASLNVLDR